MQSGTDEQAPPSYDPSQTAGELPGYDNIVESLVVYTIGGQHTTPLVSIAEIKAHLLLLAAFHRLHTLVTEAEWWYNDKTTSLDFRPLPEAKWGLFVTRAHHRFGLWLRQIVKRPSRTSGALAHLQKKEVPPLDVLLILHAYLLNPLNFHEDAHREHPELDKISSFPLLIVGSMIDMETLEYTPSDEQIAEWEQRTATSFSLPLATGPNDTVGIACPKCSKVTAVRWITIPTLRSSDDTSGTGYAQNDFTTACTSCGFVINRDALRVFKLVQDVAEITSSENAALAKTLLNDTTGVIDPVRGRALSLSLLQSFRNESAEAVSTPAELAERFDWKMVNVRRSVEAGCSGRSAMDLLAKSKLSGYFSAYSGEHPYSLDLVSSVLRISVFTSQMHEIGWTEPGKFDINTQALKHAIQRYHTFLDLASKTLRKIFIPTRDIDLVWHTHMLRFEKYREDTIKFLSRILNHEDQIEEGKISGFFDETATTWKAKTKSSYSSCPCLPQPPPFDESQSSIKFWKKKKENSLVVEPPRPPPLVEHPSDHNSVIILGDEKFVWLRGMREERFGKEKGKGKAKGLKGKGRQAGPSTLNEEAEATAINGRVTADHERAFIRPHSEAGFRKTLGASGWALAVPFDPRVVDAEMMARGTLVTGVEPIVTLDTLNQDGYSRVFAARAAQGASWANTL